MIARVFDVTCKYKFYFHLIYNYLINPFYPTVINNYKYILLLIASYLLYFFSMIYETKMLFTLSLRVYAKLLIFKNKYNILLTIAF